MAKIKQEDDTYIDAPNAKTKIQLLTKTHDSNTLLKNVQLDIGEPLVNTNDKTLIIGTSDNQSASDPNAIVLGNGRNVITNNGNNTITLKHFDGNDSTAGSAQTISINGGALSADGDGNVSVDTQYTLSAASSSNNKVEIQLAGSGNAESSTIPIEAKGAVIRANSETKTIEIDATQIQTNQIQVAPIYKSLGINPKTDPDPDKNEPDYIDSQGWYRIFEWTMDTGSFSPFCLFTIGRSHNSPVNETYTFLITVNNDDVNITQLSGQRHSSYIIDQIRVPMEKKGGYHKEWYVDIHLKEYYTLREDASKQYYAQSIAVWGIGTGKFQEPTEVDENLGTGYDIKTFSTNIGLYNSGNISAPEITTSGNISISGMNSSSIKLKAITARNDDGYIQDPDWITIENIGDDKAFIRFTYNVNNGNENPDESSWRIGYDGLGDADNNKFVINTTHSNDKTVGWREAFSISQDTLTATFNGPLTTTHTTDDGTITETINGANISKQKFNGATITSDGAITAGESGSLQRVTASSFNAISDARLKENFQPLVPEKSILDLPTYKFDFINGEKDQIGCKAQDLQEICPEIVDEGDDGYLSIKESKIVYLLLEEVKKLRKEIDYLKGLNF